MPRTEIPASNPPVLWTVPAGGWRARSLQILLLAAASFLLPAAAHAAGLPVRALLPMHWPVLLAGLVYGARTGAWVGAAAPALAHVVSGMPRLAVLPAMTAELALYGLLAGWLRQRRGWNRFAAVAAAIAGGRLLFVAVAFATGASGPNFPGYLESALLPGLVAAAAQVALLPLAARLWVDGAARE